MIARLCLLLVLVALWGVACLAPLTDTAAGTTEPPPSPSAPAPEPGEKECHLKFGDQVYVHLVGDVCDGVEVWLSLVLTKYEMEILKLKKRLEVCGTL